MAAAAPSASEAAAVAASAAADHPSPRSGRSNRHHHHPHSSHVGVRRDPEDAVIPPAEPSDRPLHKQPMATPDDDGAGQNSGGNAAPEPPPPSNRGKKQAWRRPANGFVDSGPVVMGAASWPALSESAKASPKSTTPPPPAASDSPKPIGDGSVSNLDLSSTPNNAAVGRQRSFKRGGGGGSNSSTSGPPPNGGTPQQSFPPSTSPSATVNKPTEVSQQDRAGKNSNWEHGSRGGGSGGDHHKGFRRGNNGGGSHHHNNYGNRRDQERVGYDGYHRGRDVHMQPRGPRPLIRPPPPGTPPFISPPSPLVRPPFGNPVVYPDMPSPVIYVATPPESFRGFPFVQHPPALPLAFIPPIDTQRAMLLKQIDYYFSPENLCKDVFLRQNMDDQGWVPLSLIAGFNRVRQLTDNMHYILDTVRFSTIVELQGEKIRRRNEWANWVLSSSNSQLPAASGQQSPTTPDLAHQFQTMGFGESTEQNMGILPSHSSSVLRRSASATIVKHPQVVGELNQDGNAQAVEHKDSDQSSSSKSLSRNDTF